MEGRPPTHWRNGQERSVSYTRYPGCDNEAPPSHPWVRAPPRS